MKLPEDLVEFLKIDIEAEKSLDLIFDCLVEYLTKIKSENFEYDLTYPLNGIIEKYFDCLRYYGFDIKNLHETYENIQDLIDKKDFLKYYKQSVVQKIYTSLFKTKSKDVGISNNELIKAREEIKTLKYVFRDLYNQLVISYNEVKQIELISNSISLDSFYNPDNSNKSKAKDFINEAITLIEKDKSLTEKTKRKIIDNLNKVLIEIDNKTSNWDIVMGRLHQLIFILGALGSLAGGITGIVALQEAKEKLKKASETIEKTSISVNYNNIQQIFNISESDFMIETHEAKLLPLLPQKPEE
jgi:hypothetical protein